MQQYKVQLDTRCQWQYQMVKLTVCRCVCVCLRECVLNNCKCNNKGKFTNTQNTLYTQWTTAEFYAMIAEWQHVVQAGEQLPHCHRRSLGIGQLAIIYIICRSLCGLLCILHYCSWIMQHCAFCRKVCNNLKQMRKWVLYLSINIIYCLNFLFGIKCQAQLQFKLYMFFYTAHNFKV